MNAISSAGFDISTLGQGQIAIERSDPNGTYLSTKTNYRVIPIRRTAKAGILTQRHHFKIPACAGMTALSKYHSGLIPYSCVFLILVVNFCLQSSRILQIDRIPVYLPV